MTALSPTPISRKVTDGPSFEPGVQPIFDGIVHEIGDGLRKKLAVGADTDARCKIEIEPAFGVFDRGTIKLGHA